MNAIRIFCAISVTFFIVVLFIAMGRGAVNPVYGIAVIGVGLASVLCSLIKLVGGDVTKNGRPVGMEQGECKNADTVDTSFGGNDVGDCGRLTHCPMVRGLSSLFGEMNDPM